MQTIYTTSSCLAARNKIIDLNEYRRSMELCVEEPAEDIEIAPLLWDRVHSEDAARWDETRSPSRPRVRRVAGIGAWMLDICASVGVLAMTVVFTMQIL